ncbi:myxosortase-dependent M36 family metallopeptidase [Myxococcus sp. K15C18031901]|uniref:myxosortase-dependent M36 family metallopeptidase n=1 Tax=Myxococcus dinghuensis TaxID=2906761 RepID=UPI0020A6E13D|nr:myxosortase-dependent M36 family metallopeptidase [Myxococcus dinghuensis]MCP3101855.1 myxosortase-dependent M36 family metallopeptidase [Myxococcus dinghuensis]
MKRLWMGTASAVLAVLMWSPQGYAKAGVDAFLQAPANRPLSNAAATASQRGLRINSVEGRVGVPTFVFSERALNGAAVGNKAVRTPTRATANVAAREHLRGVADIYRLSRAEVDGAELRNVHLPKDNAGAVIASYGRRVNGIEVFRNEVRVVMDANQELVAISGYLQPRNTEDERNAQASAFVVSAPQAISKAFQELTGTALDPRALASAGSQGDYAKFAVDSRLAPSTHGFGEVPRAKKVLFPLPDGLVPAYYVEVNAGPASNPEASYAAYVISARDGSLLFKHNLLQSESFTYRVWADPVSFIPHDGPQGTEATPHPTGNPDGYQAPLNVPSNLVTLQNFPFSRNDPWLPATATTTTGNNVDAYADLGGGDGYQEGYDLRAPLTNPSGRAFDYAFDVAQAPDANNTQKLAAVVNLFYLNNFLHDWFYDAGFDEAAGNAQLSNYGRGGLEGDAIRAEAQDSGGRNNANMSTPADGGRPRMQQYIFDGPTEFTVTSPAPIAGLYNYGSASFGPRGFDAQAEFAEPPSGSTTAQTTAYRIGCADDQGTTPYVGIRPFEGKIALIERGLCSFAYKVYNAQQAGAVGVIITNTSTGQFGGMAASGNADIDKAITVPSMMVTYADGNKFRDALKTSAVVGRMYRNLADDRDGTLDNEIIAHEWGHYISNRLIGNASGLTNVQGRSMGEGWGDFHALLLSVRENDANKPSNANWSGVYGMAGYTQSDGRENNGYYWGIRRVPYTTNMAKNGLTLKHIQLGTPLPSHPVAYGEAGLDNAEVHSAGEVWATMLWECYASLLNAHPFQEAQDRMKRYLVAAYKATPSQPTFLEARDAVLASAAASDPADYQRFVAAFARRGAGFGAKVPDRESFDMVGVVESYQTGNTLEVVSVKVDDTVAGCDKDGVLDAGETGRLLVTVRNVGGAAISSFTANAAFNGSSAGVVASFGSGSTLSFPALGRGEAVTASIPVSLEQAPAAANTLASLGVDVTFPHPLADGTSKFAFRGAVNYDEVAESSDTETASTAFSPWTSSLDYYETVWKADNGVWHASSAAEEMDKRLTSPLFSTVTGQDFILSFDHRFSFEADIVNGAWVYFDGGIFEVSVDEGAWVDATALTWKAEGTTLAKTSLVTLDAGTPYLGGRKAFGKSSAGFPAFSSVSVNFGTVFAGRKVRVRFRMASDGGVGAYGWDVDNIKVTGISNSKPFPSRVAETFTGTGTAPACNMLPIAVAGEAQTVNEFTADDRGVLTPTVITLNGGASVDPDGTGPLTYAWTQVAGPAVTLNGANTANPTFTASVRAATVFTFRLVVNDGVSSSYPKDTQVLVNNVNRAPAALARVLNDGPTTVDERSGTITLDGTGSTDPDGDALNYEWEQVAGPEVELDDPFSAKPTFEIPEVTEDSEIAFVLWVNDNQVWGTESLLVITVKNVDQAPTASAGEDQRVAPGATVTLAGTASDADGDAITYAWTQVSGTPVTLTGADTATPTFTAPTVTTSTTLVFSLVATANGVSTEPSTVTITVARENHKPVVHVDGAYTVHEGANVKLKATAVDDDGDELTYKWVQVAGQVVSLSGANTAELTFVAPEVEAESTLLFRLKVSDGIDSADTVDVSVTVRNLPDQGCSAAGSGASGAVIPALMMLSLVLRRRRRN